MTLPTTKISKLFLLLFLLSLFFLLSGVLLIQHFLLFHQVTASFWRYSQFTMMWHSSQTSTSYMWRSSHALLYMGRSSQLAAFWRTSITPGMLWNS
jgi:hypothetical protein